MHSMIHQSPSLQALVARFFESSDCAMVLRASDEGSVTYANEVFASAVECDSDALIGRSLWDMVTPAGADLLRQELGRGGEGRRVLVNFLDGHGHPFSAEVQVAPLEDGFALVGETTARDDGRLSEHLQRLNNELSMVARERARLERQSRKAASDLRTTLDDLEQNNWMLRKIQEFLPICMSCSRVKREGEWETLVEYLKRNRILLSHGYCPDCAEAVLQEPLDLTVGVDET